MKHDACIRCGQTTFGHRAKGICTECFNPTRKNFKDPKRRAEIEAKRLLGTKRPTATSAATLQKLLAYTSSIYLCGGSGAATLLPPPEPPALPPPAATALPALAAALPNNAN